MLDAEIEIVGVTDGFTVIVMLFEVTELGLTHAKELVMVTFTTSPFCKELVEKVPPLVATVFPLIFQTMPGDVPRLLPKELKSTEVPLQMLVLEAVMDVVGVTGFVTVKVSVLLVTAPLAQLALLVNVHVI